MGTDQRRRHGVRALTAVLALGVALGLAGCGNNSDDTEAGTAPTVQQTGTAPSVVPGRESVRLRQPRSGVVGIDGSVDPLTEVTNTGYGQVSDDRISQSTTGDSRAYQRLCLGDVDIVDSSRAISPEEWQQCQDMGLDVVQFQVGADAIVLAIQNQSIDVGTDCLSTDQARAAFQAGSTINNWSQLGPTLDDVPLKTGGPGIDSSEALFFGNYVLGADEPSLSSFRSDYVVNRSSDATRIFVAGRDHDRKLRQSLPLYQGERNGLATSLKYRLKELRDAQDELRTAKFERAKGIRDGRPTRIKAKDQQRVDDAFDSRATAINRANAARARYKPVNKIYQRLATADKRLDDVHGHVGIFKFSYYQVYEEQLRPFEIENADDGDDQQNCIFPSPQTIVNGEYPLSRQLLLTTTTRSLERPEVQSYLRYYLNNSLENSRTSSVISLPTRDVDRQLGWIEDGEAPVVASENGAPVQIQPLNTDSAEEKKAADKNDTPDEPTPSDAPPENPAR